MPRTFSLALTLAATATAAHAQTTPLTNKWDGAIRIVKQTPDCTNQFASQDNNRAFYHLNLDPDYGFRTITRFGNGEAELIELFPSNPPAGNLGYYYTNKIARGYIDDSSSGSYSFNQTPATITATTGFIDLSGTMTNYGGMTGCTITLQGTFVRVEPEEPPPPPY
jgi:hypothetical protein